MATRIALALLCTVTSFTPPTHTRPGTKLRKTRGAGGDLVDPDAGAPDDDAMTERFRRRRRAPDDDDDDDEMLLPCARICDEVYRSLMS